MLQKTKGIVLHRIKYGDNGIIVYIYTEKFGRQSFLVQGIRGKKAHGKISLLQPFFLLDMEMYYHERKGLQRLKEFSPDYAFSSIPYHNIKRTIALFLAEILYKVLKEEEQNTAMYSFIRESAVVLDLVETGTAYFHLIFLTELTRLLGFYPQNNYNTLNPFFDLVKGTFKENEPDHKHFLLPDLSQHFSHLIKEGYQGIQNYKMERTIRQELLLKILEYYKLHFELTGTINSMDVMRQIFG